MSNRSVVVAGLVALVLAGCPKKDEAVADAAASATPATVSPPVLGDAASPTTTITTAPAGTPKTATVVAKADAGAADGAAADAGAVADAGVETCCCEVPGSPASQVGQSECVKTRKGKCVKKEQCAAAPAPVVDAGPAVQQCCCDSGGGKKALKGQSECTKGGAGKCVSMKECK